MSPLENVVRKLRRVSMGALMVGAVLALSLSAWIRPVVAFFGFNPTFVLSFKDLTTTLVPSAVEEDGDAKDVKVKGRASFKASKGSDVGLDKRMKLKSKTDGGEATVVTEIEMTGDITARLRVAITSTEGLVDGVSLGFLERRAAGGGPVKRLEVVWNEGLAGFTVRAVDNGTPTGSTLDLPGATEAVVHIIDDGTDIVLHAGEPTGESITILDPEADLATIVQEADTDSAVFAFGAEGLGQKGTLWFGQLTLEFGPGIAVGAPETEVGKELVTAQQKLQAAQALLDSEATGPAAVQSMYNLLTNASTHLNTGWSALLLALDQDTLQPSTQGVDAEKNVKASLGWVFPASMDMFDEMQADGSSIKKVKSHVKVGLKKCELAIAQIAGFKSNNHGKLLKSLDFSMQ